MKEYERNLIRRLINTLERMDLDRYVEYVSNRRRMVWMNLFYGMLRGFGFSLGFTVLGAVAVAILRRIFANNMSEISGFIAEVVNAIEERM